MELKSIRNLLKQYISSKIPQKQTNIFWQMFNGIDAMFTQLEYTLNIHKRERNFLTASYLSSLRNLAAQNGFEPTLKIPSSGIASIKVSPKLFQRVGYPLYIPPYATFVEQVSGLKYYFNSNKVLRLDTDIAYLTLIEGELETKTEYATLEGINRFYLSNDNIAEGSISIICNGIEFQEVKSFFDSENVNGNNLFLVKFSNNSQTPIAIYVKNLKLNDAVTISYRLTSGELGNLSQKSYFETEDIIDKYSTPIEADSTEIEIASISGFSFGSNGTDANSLRAAIGFNHGSNLLFDAISYRDFIGKFSNVLLQDVKLATNSKTINNIYIAKKQAINFDVDVASQYKSIVESNAYVFSAADIAALSKLISENEFSLTSHNLYPANTCSYAIQVMLDSWQQVNDYKLKIEELLYSEFAKFFYDKHHIVNLELLFNNFMESNSIKFNYTVFNQRIEEEKILKKQQAATPYIVKHDEYLPILKGNFSIADNNYQPLQIFFDINVVVKL